MNREEIYAILDTMQSKPRSKTFLNHLIRTYLPIDNIVKVYDVQNRSIKCVLSKEDLTVDGTLVITNADTTTYMSANSFDLFYDWVITKMFQGDKHIIWLLGPIDKTDFFIMGKSIQDDTVQLKIKNFIKRTNSTSFTIGDSNNALAILKAKMEAKGL